MLPALRWPLLLLNYRAAQPRNIWKSNSGSASIPGQDKKTQDLMLKPAEEPKQKRLPSMWL